MAREPGRIGCAAESFGRGEPLTATASRVTRWLLVEQPGPWGREALIESRLEDRIAHTLRSRARRHGVRVVLIRRPGREAEPPPHRAAYLVRTGATERWIRRYDVREPDELIDIDLTLQDAPAPGSQLESTEVRLVCTNGRHDPCCADFGRPVVRALHAQRVSDVWESSHVGGDRFAANLVILPSGVYYGRVEPDAATELIAAHGRGVLDLDHYRGRSCYQPITQAGEIFIRRELDERGVDALSHVSTERDGDTATVRFRRAQDRFTAVVHRVPGPPEHLTCSDHGLSRPWTYHLVQFAGPD